MELGRPQLAAARGHPEQAFLAQQDVPAVAAEAEALAWCLGFQE